MRYIKWTLKADQSIPFPDNNIDFENERVKINNGVLSIKKNYSWDGCTPKIKIGKVVLGTWDGFINKKTGKQQCYYASLYHDIMYQFKISDRLTADKMFLEQMKANRFILSYAYYVAVRSFGWTHWNK